MRKFVLITVGVFALFFCDIVNAQGVGGSRFDPMELSPALEMHGFRIDVMRQEEEEQVNDSTTEDMNVDYHVMGFDLGNGLFFDFNENLSFRLDYFLDYDQDNFVVQQILRPKSNKGRTEYVFEDEVMNLRFPRSKRLRYQYHLYSTPEGYEARYKKRYLYTVDTTGWGIRYMDGERKDDEIRKISDGLFTIGGGLWTEDCELRQGLVYLGDYYFLQMSEDRRLIEVCRSGIIKDHVLYRLERDGDNIYVYRNRTLLRRLELGEDSVGVYDGKRLGYRYRAPDGVE